MENEEKVLICVAGRSGCGKDMLVNTVCERAGASKVLSYTTRPRRDNEGETHRFVDEEAYQKMLEDGQVAAYTEIAGNRYWSTLDQLFEANYYIIDPIGIKTLRELNIPNLRIVVVYIKADDSIREYRALTLRGDDKVTYRKRCLAENSQFREFVRNEAFDYCISNNGDLAKAYTVLRYISMIEGAIHPKREEVTE